MTVYALDIGFVSSVSPISGGQCFGTHGWVERSTSGVWVQKGQRPSGKGMSIPLQAGDTLDISFFDAATTPATSISELTFAFAAGQRGQGGQNSQPFEPPDATSVTLTPGYGSSGLGWGSPNVAGGTLYGIVLTGGPGNSGGDWEITVSFVANDKTFSVDPELQLVGGGSK